MKWPYTYYPLPAVRKDTLICCLVYGLWLTGRLIGSKVLVMRKSFVLVSGLINVLPLAINLIFIFSAGQADTKFYSICDSLLSVVSGFWMLPLHVVGETMSRPPFSCGSLSSQGLICIQLIVVFDI